MTSDQVADVLGLGDKLLDIDDGKFRQVVGLLEHMGDHPEVQRTFSRIRPRLAELRPKRRPTLKRLFCEPFEDLFDPAAPGEKRPANTIERGVIAQLWPQVEAQLGTDAVAAFAARQRAAETGSGLTELSAEFWAACAGIVDGIAGQLEASRYAAMDPRTVRDIARALAIAPALADLKRALAPKPLSKLHQDHLDEVQEIGRTVARADMAALKVFLWVAAARLSDPSLLLSALQSLEFGQKASDRAVLFLEMSDGVIQQIEERSRAMATADGVADRLAVADLAAGLVASLDATRGAMEAGRRSEFDQRLKQVRGAVHDMVRAQILDHAEAGILDAVAAGAGKECVKQAENHARALRKCATIADGLGLRTQLRQVADKAVASLTGAAQSALGGLGEGGAGLREGYAAIRMIELIAGPAEANRILTEIQRSTGAA